MQRKIGLKMKNDSEQTISRSTLAVSLPSDLENNRKCIFKMFGWHDHHVPSFIPKNALFKWQSDNYQVYFLQSCKNDLQTAIINVFNQSPNILRRTIGIYEVFLVPYKVLSDRWLPWVSKQSRFFMMCLKNDRCDFARWNPIWIPQ